MRLYLLLVDDDELIHGMIQDGAAREGFAVQCVGTVAAALSALSRNIPDLVILDWVLPDRPGVELCRLLRNDPKTTALPILMLTSKDHVKDKVGALDTGADDYLTKPFELSELLARVRAILRRKTPWLLQAQVLDFEELKLDPSRFAAYVQKRDAGLTKMEFELLYLLAANAGRIVQRTYIEARVLGIDYPTEARALDVYMSRMKEKLGPKVAKWIETARGLGYIFSPQRIP